MLQGMGKIGVRTSSPNPGAGKIMYAPRANSFKFSKESTEEEAMAFPHGECDTLQIVDTVNTQTKYSITIGIESFDSLDIAFMMDEQVSASKNATLPEIINGVIPVGVTPMFPSAGLVVDQAISVTVLDSLQQTRLLTQVPAAATLATGQYKVTAGNITFHADQANMPVNIMFDKVIDSTNTVGLETKYLKWGDVAFFGIACGPRFPKPIKLFAPAMRRMGNQDLSIGQKTTVEFQFRLKVIPPYRSPIIFADL